MPKTAQPRSATKMDPTCRSSVSDLDCPGGQSGPCRNGRTVSTSRSVIVLPGADSAEGIARGRGATFYAGELFTGDIFRGNIRLGTATKFIDAPEGRNALGMVFDRRHNLLFVAGGATGQG